MKKYLIHLVKRILQWLRTKTIIYFVDDASVRSWTELPTRLGCRSGNWLCTRAKFRRRRDGRVICEERWVYSGNGWSADLYPDAR